jgi:hypothetical protein
MFFSFPRILSKDKLTRNYPVSKLCLDLSVQNQAYYLQYYQLAMSRFAYFKTFKISKYTNIE